MYALILSDHLNIGQNIIHCLARIGIKSVVIADHASRFLAASRFCKELNVLPDEAFTDQEEMLMEALRIACCRYDFTMVFPTGQGSSYFISKNLEKVSSMVPTPPTPDPDTFINLYDKWKFSVILEENGIAQPKTVLVEGLEAAKSVSDALEFPILTKPLKQHGGKGIKRFEEPAAVYSHAKKLSKEKHELPFIAQEYVPGEDIDLSVLCEQGKIIAWTVQQKDSSGVVKFLNRGDIVRIGEGIVSASRYHGLAHFDMRIDARNDSVKVIECNPRFWGTTHASCFAGINFPALCIDLDKGRELKITELKNPVSFVSTRRIVATLLKGPLAWKTINLNAALTAAFNDTFDELSYLLDYLQHKNPRLVNYIGEILVKHKGDYFQKGSQNVFDELDGKTNKHGNVA